MTTTSSGYSQVRDDKNPIKHKVVRFSPSTDLQLNYLVTAPAWGDRTEIDPELNERLQKNVLELIRKGEIREIIRPDGTRETVKYLEDTIVKSQKDVWLELQAIFTRDLRLGNLNSSEVNYCNYMINLAGDLLDEGYYSAFGKALRLAIAPLELSQSRSFALRKLMNTLISQQKITEEEAPKRSLLGSGKHKEGN